MKMMVMMVMMAMTVKKIKQKILGSVLLIIQVLLKGLLYKWTLFK